MARISLTMKFLIFGLLLAGNGLVAQETARVVNEDFSQGIIIELQANLLSQSTDFLAVSDSSAHELALSNLALDNQNIWIKNSANDAEIENKVYWNYDAESKLLFVDLRGIKGSLPAGSTLQLTILPLRTFKAHLSLAVFEAPANSGNLAEAMQRISDIDVDLK